MDVQKAVRIGLVSVLPLLGGGIVLVLAMGWLAGMFREKIAPATPVRPPRALSPDWAASLDEVRPVDKEYFAEAVGTLRASTRTVVAARVLAPISEVRVRAGDRVARGDVLIQLDRRDMETRLSQAQAALEAAQAQAELAEKEFRRDSQLMADKVISERDFEQSRTAASLAQARVRQAEQAVTEAEVNLSYASIAASQDGTVVDRLAEPGDIAQPGVPLLVLYDPQSLRLEVPVMENLAVRLEVGEELMVHIDALERDVQAVVDEIVPQAEAASRSFLVKVALIGTEGLYEGMFGRLRIPAGMRRHLCVAVAAVRTMGQLQFVDVVGPDGRTVQRRFITTGRLGMPGRIEVLSGLEAGEQVIVPAETEPRSES